MKRNKSICLIAGSAPLYRKPIYMLMGQKFGCDFVLGAGPTKQMNIMELPNKVTAVETLRLGKLPLYRQKGALRLSKGYDVLILCMGLISITEWLILLSARLRHQKTYIWSHGWLGKDRGIKKFLSRIYFGLSDGIFVYNERSTALMGEGGIKREKLHTIYNSLDYDAQLPLRLSMTPMSVYSDYFKNDNKNIVFIGRLTKVKRFDLLIDAISILKQRGEFVNVTFIGDGVDRQNMESMIIEKGISEQVWFYGACYDEITNARLIYNADLCVSPGNIGLTAMHVLMFGCPAITNDDYDHQMPEFEAIKEGVTGSFFRAGSSQSLANCISNWFSSNIAKREEVRHNCFAEIDAKWNPHNQLKILSRVLYDNKD